MKKFLSALVSAAVCASSLAAVPVAGAAGTEIIPPGISVGAAIPSSGTCGDNAKWEADGSTLRITGTGAMTSYSISTSTPWYGRRTRITDIVISDGITEIGACDFAELSATSVSIPNSVTSIGRGAFSNCKSLQSIEIPESVTYISAQAFRNCSALKEIYIRNPKCTISGSAGTICTMETEQTVYFNGTICAPGGSKAEEYAKAYGYNFRAVGSSEGTATTQTSTTTTTTTTIKITTTTTTQTSTTSSATSSTTSTVTTTVPPVNNDYKSGDVNNDGLVDAVDASLVLAEYALRSSSQNGKFDDRQSKAADVDHNGLVDAVDSSKILAYYAYLSSNENSTLTISEFIDRK